MKVHTNPHVATAERIARDLMFVTLYDDAPGRPAIEQAVHRRVRRGSIPQPEWDGLVRLTEAAVRRLMTTPKRPQPPPLPPQPPRSVA
jgi:hypothetical protein